MISMDKEYRTRDGCLAEVLKVGMNHHTYPVAVMVTMDDGSQGVFQRTSTGRVVPSRESGGDLIEVKPRIKQEAWLNVYAERRPCAHLTKEEADKIAGNDRIACVPLPIDCEHGEGL